MARSMGTPIRKSGSIAKKAPATRQTTVRHNQFREPQGGGGGKFKPAPTPAPVKPITSGSTRGSRQGGMQGVMQPQATFTPNSSSGGTGGGYTGPGSNLGTNSTGGYSGMGSNPGAIAKTADGPTENKVVAPSETDWLKGDSIYQATQAALGSQLKQFQGDVGYQDDKGNWVNGLAGNTYQGDYDRNLRDLGWQNGAWNADDRLTSYGSAYNNQLEDFAARGMLDSSGYAQAFGNLGRGFNDQKSGLDQSRKDFFADLLSQWSGTKTDNEQGLQQARIESIGRRAAQYGLEP